MVPDLPSDAPSLQSWKTINSRMAQWSFLLSYGSIWEAWNASRRLRLQRVRKSASNRNTKFICSLGRTNNQRGGRSVRRTVSERLWSFQASDLLFGFHALARSSALAISAEVILMARTRHLS